MSWKQYGGLKNLDSNNNISVRSVVTDTFTIRNQLLTEFQITGDTQLLGNVLMGDIDNEQNRITLAADVDAKKNVDISGNLSVNGKLIITSSGEGFFLQGTDDKRLGINVENPEAVLDIAGSYESILNVFSDQSNNRNIIARNYLQNGIAVNALDASSSAVQFYSGGDISNNKTNPDSEIKYNSNGILEIITGEDTRILSQVSISTDGSKGHIHNETLVVYDISNGTYRNLYYKEDSVYKGNAFSLIAYDSSSNTSMNITTPDGKGAVISGGAYPKDASKSMLVLDVSNNSDNKPPAQMIVSGTANEKYNTTTSINKFISQIDKYTLDVNGATYISDSQINIKSEYNMEFLNVKVHDNDGIALGSFDGDGIFHIFETTDSGINWTQNEFTYGNGNTMPSILAISKDIFINDYVKCFVTFSTGSPSLFYSIKSTEWTRYESLAMNVNDIGNDTIVSSIYSIYNNNKNHFIVGRDTKIDLLAYGINGNSTIPKDVGFTINDIDGSNTTIYAVGVGNIKRYNLNVAYNDSTYTNPGSNFTEVLDSSYNNASYTYNKVAVYNSNYAVAVGNGIITHTLDGGLNWQDNIIPDFSANDIDIVSKDEAIAVGDNGKIYVTHNASNTWERLDDNYINGTGMKSYLTGIVANNINNINSVTISNNNVVTGHTNKEITYNGTDIDQIPEGRLLSTHAPSLFNRHASSTLDVIGSINVSGDLILHDRGGLKTTDVSFGLLKTNTKQIDFGLSGELINIGSESGLVDMKGRLQVADDTSFNADVFVSGDISANTNLYLGGDASFNKDVFVSGDISANTNLYLGGDASFNADVFVSGDISANTNLYLGGDASFNADVFVSGDISGNSKLYLGGDASFNKDVFVSGDISANTNLYLGGDASFNNDVFVSGDISANTNLYLGADAILYSNLDVCGNTIINGSLTVDGSLNFRGLLSQTDISHNVLISDQLKVHNIADNEVALVVRQDTNTSSIAEFKRGETTKVEINNEGNIVMDSVLKIMDTTISNNITNNTEGALYVKGGTRLDGSLNVMGETYFARDITFVGEVTSLSEYKTPIINVTSSNSSNNKFTYEGESLKANKTSNFNIDGGANFKDSIVVDKIFYGYQMDISGDASFNADVFINGDISGNSRLHLGGDASLNADLFVSGVTTLGVVNNTGVPLYVDGSGAMRIPVGASNERPSNPEIGYIRYNTDDTTFEGWGANDAWGTLGGVSNPAKTTQVYVGTNDEIVFKTNSQIRQTIDNTTGDVSINTNLFVNRDISANTHLHLGGDASLNSNVFVAGDISANTHLYLGGDASLNSNVFVAGDISANTHLYLGGDASLNSDVFVAGDISANTNLYLGGDASLNSKLFVSGDISANTNLNLGGDASLNADVFIAGDISANSNLYLGGDVSFNKNLFVSGVTTLGVVNNTDVPLYVDGSGAMRIPVGATVERPNEAGTGQIRFNTTDDTFEGYDGSNWGSLGGVSNSDKSSRVYINDVSAIVFETDSKIRETIDICGNVSFDVSNSEGYGEIKMHQSDTATILHVKDSSNNNIIKIQNQDDTFKLIYDQSGVDSSRMEMKDNEINLYPNYPESTFTSNYNGVMIGNDSVLRDSLYDKTWSQIGYINKGGTKYGNTVSVSQDGKKMAVGEYETTSTTSRVYIYDIYEKDKRLIDTINIDSGHVTSIDINQDGENVVVGIYDASDGSPINTGGIELYELNDGTYLQVGSISYGSTKDAQLGHTTSINNDGSIFAAGQYTRNTGTSDSTIEGGVLIFERQDESISIIADISYNRTSDSTQFKEMGRSIELNGKGDRIIIGGTNDTIKDGDSIHRVYIYQKQTDGSWNEVLDISNIIPNTGMNFGLSVAMSNDGKVIAVATQESDDSVEDGVVFIYELTETGSDLTYTQRGSTIRLSGIDDMDTFGASMSLNADGSVIAIASGSLDNFNGHAYIYKYLNSDWELIKDIPGSTSSNLGGIHNHEISNAHLISDEDGICLDATGNLVAIGAPNLYSANNTNASGNGSAYLYRNQTYTLGVNEKLRVKGDIVVDDGNIDVSGNIIVSGSSINKIISNQYGIGNHIQSTNAGGRNVFEGGSNYIYSQEINGNGATGGHNRLFATQTNGYNYIKATGSGGSNYIEANVTGSNRLKVNNEDKIVTNASTTTVTNTDIILYGNVGIGTTNPQAKLDVDGSANITGDLNIKDGNLTIKHSSTTGDFDPYIVLNSNADTSNHGGTSSLFLTEQFFGSDKIQGAYVEYNGGDNFFVIGTQNATDSGSNVLRVEALRINRESGNIISASAPTDDTHLTNKLYVDNEVDTKVSKSGDTMTGNLDITGNATINGNVGIGTTNPSALLHTYSGSFGDNGFSAKFARHVSEGQYNGIGLGTANQAIKSAIIQERTLTFISKLHLCHNPDNTNTDVSLDDAVLTIHNGNVGIGTTTPTAKLEVNGVAKINSGGGGVLKFTSNDTDGLGRVYFDVSPAQDRNDTIELEYKTSASDGALYLYNDSDYLEDLTNTLSHSEDWTSYSWTPDNTSSDTYNTIRFNPNANGNILYIRNLKINGKYVTTEPDILGTVYTSFDTKEDAEWEGSLLPGGLTVEDHLFIGDKGHIYGDGKRLQLQKGQIYGDDNGGLAFYTDNDTNHSRILIESDGNVKISNNVVIGVDGDPSVKLVVDGSANITGLLKLGDGTYEKDVLEIDYNGGRSFKLSTDSGGINFKSNTAAKTFKYRDRDNNVMFQIYNNTNENKINYYSIVNCESNLTTNLFMATHDSDISLYPPMPMNSASVDEYSVSASSYYNEFYPYIAFDSLPTTDWLSAYNKYNTSGDYTGSVQTVTSHTDSPHTGEYIEINGRASCITTFQVRTSATRVNHTPKKITLVGKYNNNWIHLGSWDGLVHLGTDTNGHGQYYINSDVYHKSLLYNAYRIIVEKTNGQNHCAISEIKIITKQNNILVDNYGVITTKQMSVSNPIDNLNITDNLILNGEIGDKNDNVACGVGLMFRTIDENSISKSRISSLTSDGDFYGLNGSESSTSLLFETSNTGGLNKQMIITSDGNVGIGTTNPTTKLEVDGDTRIYDALYIGKTGENASRMIAFNDGSDDSRFTIVMDTGLNTLISNTNPTSYMRFYNNQGDYKFDLNDGGNYTALTIRGTDGNVGIGTTDPQAKLEVNGIVNVTAQHNINGSEEASEMTFRVFNSTPTYWNAGSITSYVRANNDTHSNYPGGLMFKTKPPGDKDLALESRMVIDANGNVGIGTTNPQAKLHVSSGVGANGNCTFILEADIENNNENANPQMVFRQDGEHDEGGIGIDNDSNRLTISSGAHSDSGIVFKTSSTPGTDLGDNSIFKKTYERMRITDTGNVGIGTNNPSALLHTYSGSFGDNGFSAKFARHVSDGQYNGIGLGTAYQVMKSAIFQERYSTYISKLHLCHNSDNTSTNVSLDDAVLTIYNGNVGIGTTNPGAKLDVSGTANITGNVTTGNVLQVGTNTNDETPKTIYFGGTSGDNYTNLCVIENRIYSTGTEKRELLLFSGNDTEGTAGPDRIRLKGGNIQFDTYASDDSDRTTETTKMIIDKDGNVGIGITDPTTKLEVDGDTRIYDALYIGKTGENAQRMISFNDGSNDDRFKIVMDTDLNTIISNTNPTSYMQFYNNRGDYKFDLYDGANSYTALTIQGTTGNVGIGTTNPDCLLHVADTSVNTSAINVANGISASSIVNTQSNNIKLHTLDNINNTSWTSASINALRIYSYVGQYSSGAGCKSEMLLGTRCDGNGKIQESRGFISYDNNFTIYKHIPDITTNTASKISVDTNQVYPKIGINGTEVPTAILTCHSNGNVGIGTTNPQVKLEIDGTCEATTFNATSDIRVKTNIETIEPNEALEQINKLEPKTYKFYDSEETHYGLVAQDAEKIIPESVKSTGTKMIPSIGETCKLINSGKTIVLDTKTTSDMVATKLEFDDISGNKQSVGIESFEGDKYIHLKSSIEEHAIKTSDGLTIYVHGHEVNDFRSINYNTIVAANVAATKALTRELNETRTELNETRTELNELKKLVEQLLNK